MKKIYFAGSIRGGRDDAALYQRIIRHIAETDKILTEHIGSTDIEADEKDMTDSDIYRQDTAWLRECDMVIAECTNASLGVGYEMAFAESLSKPVHIFYDSRRTRLSAMLAGDPYFHIHPYSDEAELVSLYGLNPTEAILKYHGGNKQYPQPEGAETAFASLDLSFSKVRVVLLVQIGKEGWDCKSLTGVILPQKGL